MGKGGILNLVTHYVHEIPHEKGQVVLFKQGRIVEDGPKGEVLNPPNLTALFDTPVELVYYGGWLQVISATPATDSTQGVLNNEEVHVQMCPG
jgi:iron complex transport system ATP-binding protein